MLAELLAEAIDDVGRDRAEARHGERDLLDLVLVHELEQARATFLAERQHEDRGLLSA